MEKFPLPLDEGQSGTWHNMPELGMQWLQTCDFKADLSNPSKHRIPSDVQKSLTTKEQEHLLDSIPFIFKKDEEYLFVLWKDCSKMKNGLPVFNAADMSNASTHIVDLMHEARCFLEEAPLKGRCIKIDPSQERGVITYDSEGTLLYGNNINVFAIAPYQGNPFFDFNLSTFERLLGKRLPKNFRAEEFHQLLNLDRRNFCATFVHEWTEGREGKSVEHKRKKYPYRDNKDPHFRRTKFQLEARSLANEFLYCMSQGKMSDTPLFKPMHIETSLGFVRKSFSETGIPFRNWKNVPYLENPKYGGTDTPSYAVGCYYALGYIAERLMKEYPSLKKSFSKKLQDDCDPLKMASLQSVFDLDGRKYVSTLKAIANEAAHMPVPLFSRKAYASLRALGVKMQDKQIGFSSKSKEPRPIRRRSRIQET